MIDPDPQAAQFINGTLGDLVFRQPGDVFSFSSELRDHDGHVCLRSSKGCLQMGGLRKALVPGGGQSKHDFAKGNDSRHKTPEHAEGLRESKGGRRIGCKEVKLPPFPGLQT